MKQKLLLFLTLLTLSTTTFAQSRLGLFIGGGTTWYYGDMNDRLLTHRKLFSYYFTGGLLYRASQHIYISGSFAAGRVVGADSLAIQEFNLRRNLHFRNDIWQGALHLEYRLLGFKNGKTRNVTPYILGGIAYYHFNPVALLNGNEVALQPLGTEGQYIQGDGNSKPYKLYKLSAPLGIGVEFRLTNAFAARVEIINHFTFFDYFDDVSTDYADSTLLAATPKGALAVEMANNIADGYPRTGYGRGDPKNNDTYVFAGVTLLYTPVSGSGGGNGNKQGHRGGGGGGKKKKKKSSCPAFD